MIKSIAIYSEYNINLLKEDFLLIAKYDDKVYKASWSVEEKDKYLVVSKITEQLKLFLEQVHYDEKR